MTRNAAFAAADFVRDYGVRPRAAEGTVDESDGSLTLYHFARGRALPLILRDGYLDTTYSGLDPRQYVHDAPPAVWLSTRPTPGMLSSFGYRSVRFTVKVPAVEVVDFRDWMERIGEDPALVRGHLGASGPWRLIGRRIPSAEWLEVRDGNTGLPIPCDQIP